MIHRFPTLFRLFFNRSNYEQGEWAEALRENGVGVGAAGPGEESWWGW